jgi:hypothetical protein
VIEADSQYLPFKAKMVTSQAHTWEETWSIR